MYLFRTGLCVLVAMGALVGCAQPYKRPPSQEAATLRLPPPITVFTYFDNGNDCSDLRKIGDEDNPFLSSDRRMQVPAGRRIAVTVITTGAGISSCPISLSFELKARRQYEIEMTVQGQQCFARVLDTTDGRPVAADNIGVKRVRGIFTCKPDE